MEMELRDTLRDEDENLIDKLCVQPAEREHAKTKKRQARKISEMLASRKDRFVSLRPQGLKRWVMNLSDKVITPTQEEVLSLGLNFAPVPSKLPLLDTVANLEGVARTLGQDDANELRGRV